MNHGMAARTASPVHGRVTAGPWQPNKLFGSTCRPMNHGMAARTASPVHGRFPAGPRPGHRRQTNCAQSGPRPVQGRSLACPRPVHGHCTAIPRPVHGRSLAGPRPVHGRCTAKQTAGASPGRPPASPRPRRPCPRGGAAPRPAAAAGRSTAAKQARGCYMHYYIV